MKYQLLFCILMILLCGCGNEKKVKLCLTLRVSIFKMDVIG